MDIRRQTGTIRVKIAIKQLLKSCNRSLGEVSQQISHPVSPSSNGTLLIEISICFLLLLLSIWTVWRITFIPVPVPRLWLFALYPPPLSLILMQIAPVGSRLMSIHRFFFPPVFSPQCMLNSILYRNLDHHGRKNLASEVDCFIYMERKVRRYLPLIYVLNQCKYVQSLVLHPMWHRDVRSAQGCGASTSPTVAYFRCIRCYGCLFPCSAHLKMKWGETRLRIFSMRSVLIICWLRILNRWRCFLL